MATAGVLQLLFTTDASDLSKGVKKARVEVVAFGGVVEKTGSKISGLWAGIGAAASVGGLAAFAKQGMDSANSTRILAEQLGTSTEALSKLQYAAKLADVDSATLSGSLQKMQLRLGEIATTGTGKAAGVLERMGLDAATLAEQDPAKTFHELLGVIERIPNPAERMKVAVDIFGKSASGILNLALQGSKGIADMEAEADTLGVTLSDIDAAKIDEADDAMTRIWEAIGGVGRALATELAPYLSAAAKAFTDMGQAGVNSGSFISQGLDWVVSGIGAVLDGLQLAGVAWQGFTAIALEGISKVLSGLDSWLQAVYRLNVGQGARLNTGLSDWAKAAESAAVTALDAASEGAGKEWAHAAARQLVDDIKLKSEAGAAAAVDRSKLFRGGRGEGVETSGGKGHLTKAMEFGTAEAANTILRTKFGVGSEKGLTKIADNTRRQADATDRMLDLMREMAIGANVSEVDVWAEFARA